MLVGDPKQLQASSELMSTHIPATHGGTREHLHYHTRSTMQRLSEAAGMGSGASAFAPRGGRAAVLRQQYRMHPSICHVCDTHFYRRCRPAASRTHARSTSCGMVRCMTAEWLLLPACQALQWLLIECCVCRFHSRHAELITDDLVASERTTLLQHLAPGNGAAAKPCTLITTVRLADSLQALADAGHMQDPDSCRSTRRALLPTAHVFGYSNTDEAHLAVHVRTAYLLKPGYNTPITLPCKRNM